jgi:hypothetical protein
VTWLAGGTTSGYSDGTGTNAKFNNPNSITVDATRTLWVTDTNNDAWRTVSTSGQVLTNYYHDKTWLPTAILLIGGTRYVLANPGRIIRCVSPRKIHPFLERSPTLTDVNYRMHQ